MSVANCRSFLGGSFGALCLIWPFPTRQPITLEEETRNLMKVAYAQIRENHYEAADATLHQILKLLTDAFHASHISPSEHSGRRARVFSELANLRLLQRNYTDAEKLFIETIRSSIAGGMDPDDACIVELSLKLSLIYDKLGDSEKALLGFKHCFEVQLKRMGELDQQSDLTEQEVNDIALFGLVSNAFAQ
uniref:TPR_REGION domain-containing protein n=1 Tax=Mesocestoides corti TaxID=53468 RepID=A0A5K3EME4_MESCO